MKLIPYLCVIIIMFVGAVLYDYYVKSQEYPNRQYEQYRDSLANIIKKEATENPTEKEKKCDSGYSYMPTIGTTSLRIQADTCLPDSIVKGLWKEFNQNMCGEMGISVWSMGTEGEFNCEGCLAYDRQGDWNDSTGNCIWTEEYTVVRKGKRVSITRDQYDSISKKNAAAQEKEQRQKAKKEENAKIKQLKEII